MTVSQSRACPDYNTTTVEGSGQSLEIERQRLFADSFCTRDENMLRVVFVTLVVVAVYVAGLPLDPQWSNSLELQETDSIPVRVDMTKREASIHKRGSFENIRLPARGIE
ncbi:hypothetical protein ScPMuIL_004155 [Solemya velum]